MVKYSNVFLLKLKQQTKFYCSATKTPLTNKLCITPIFLSPLCSVLNVANVSPITKCVSVPFSINSD